MTVAFLGAVMAELAHWPWNMIAALAGCAALAILLWINFGKPWFRARRLARSCDVHFVVRSMQEYAFDYVVQDEQRHHTSVLAVPSNSSVYIEIGVSPLIHFNCTAVVFGCNGDNDKKPYATKMLDRFTNRSKNTFVPGVDERHSIDIHRFYVLRNERPINVGTHHLFGYEVVTQQPGTYKTHVMFLTDEIQGSAELTIVVEDKPRTRMKCLLHEDCYVRPIRKIA